MGEPHEPLVTFRDARISAVHRTGKGDSAEFTVTMPTWVKELFAIRGVTRSVWASQLRHYDFEVPHIPIILGDERMTLSEARAAYEAYEALPVATQTALAPAMEALATQLAERGVL